LKDSTTQKEKSKETDVISVLIHETHSVTGLI